MINLSSNRKVLEWARPRAPRAGPRTPSATGGGATTSRERGR